MPNINDTDIVIENNLEKSGEEGQEYKENMNLQEIKLLRIKKAQTL